MQKHIRPQQTINLITAVSAGLLLLLISVVVFADEFGQANDAIYEIACWTEIAQSPNLAAQRQIPLDENGCYADVNAYITAQMQQHGYTIVFVPNQAVEATHQPLFTIAGPMDVHSVPLMSLENTRSNMLHNSPVLSTHINGPANLRNLTLYADNTLSRAMGAKLFAALALYSLGDCTAALPYFHAAAEPAITRAQFMFGPPLADFIAFYQGNCAILAGDYALARQYFESYLTEDLFLASVTPPTHLAWVLIQLGETDKAFDLMQRMLDILYDDTLLFTLPGNQSTAHVNRARLYLMTNQFDAARTDVDRAITIEPENPAYYTLRGQVNLALYEWDTALGDYTMALEIDPNYSEAYFYRGVAYYSILQTGVSTRDEALADFEAYLLSAPAGIHAEAAARYAESIRTADDALTP